MDNTTKTQVEQMINRGWYQKSQTLGEGGWGQFYAMLDIIGKCMFYMGKMRIKL